MARGPAAAAATTAAAATPPAPAAQGNSAKSPESQAEDAGSRTRGTQETQGRSTDAAPVVAGAGHLPQLFKALGTYTETTGTISEAAPVVAGEATCHSCSRRWRVAGG